MHMQTWACTLSYSLSCPVTHADSGTCHQYTVSRHMHTHLREKKLKELLPGGGQGDKARHVGTGCQFSFLRPVRCFGTDPPFYNLSHPADRWPHPNCWHCWTLAHTPLSHMNVPSALHLLPALVPRLTFSLVRSNSVNMNLCVFQASSSEICFFLEEGTRSIPGAGTQSDFVLPLPAWPRPFR